MIARTARKRRAGFALLLVIGFNVMLLAVWSVAYRSVGAAIRVEMTRSLRRTRDDGTMTALGQGVALLQFCSPINADSSPITSPESYTCYVQLTLNTPTTTSPRWFAVVYTPVPLAADGTAQQGVWAVHAYPVDSGGSPTMPSPGTAFPPQ